MPSFGYETPVKVARPYGSYRYDVFSLKAGRRMTLFDKAALGQFIELKADHEVTALCERPIKIPASKSNRVSPVEGEGGESEGGLPSDLPVLKFLDCPAPQLTPYGRYVSEGSPYATQHGVKGAQFDRVLVVMDEEENDYRLYDYEKVLGDAKAGAADRAAFANGEDNTWSRTLRLLYVCATRAKRGLAMVFFVENPSTTVTHIVASGIFPESSVITQDDLTES